MTLFLNPCYDEAGKPIQSRKTTYSSDAKADYSLPLSVRFV